MDLSRAKYLLPNSLTMASLFAGFNSIYLSANATTVKEFSIAAWLIVIAMVCDAFDGRVARMTKTESDLGVQLDSLADAVSFGIAPAILLFAWGLEPLGLFGKFCAFCFAASAVLRLARYNVMASKHEGVMKYFLGLPTPLAAGAVVSIVMAHLAVTGHATSGANFSVAAMSVMLGGLMVSNVRYRTFKDVNFRGPAGVAVLALTVGSIALGLLVKPSVAFVVLMVVYILLGPFGTLRMWQLGVLHDEDEDEEEFEYEDSVSEKRRR